MYSASGLFDPISGTIVHGELRRIEQALFAADWAEAKARLEREPYVTDLARTPDQRRADALVEMARRSGTMPKDGKPPRPLFTLLLGAAAFSRLCQLANGTVVAPGAVVPWADDAVLERILFEGDGHRVIAVSRRRFFTGALRRLLQVRDRQCFHEFCEVPSEDCQADHVVPWTEGGMTSQENGRMACGFHNRQRNGREPPSPEDSAGGADDDDDSDLDDDEPEAIDDG
jgi:hypothetical protein